MSAVMRCPRSRMRSALSSNGALGRLSPPALRLSLRLIRPRLPPGDDPHALAGLGVVGDQREVAAELDDARQLAGMVIGAADGFGGGLIDCEHRLQLGRDRGSEQPCRRPPYQA